MLEGYGSHLVCLILKSALFSFLKRHQCKLSDNLTFLNENLCYFGGKKVKFLKAQISN